MEGYIQAVLKKYDYPLPSKPQHSPHRQCEITYIAKQQLVPDTSPTLYISGIRRIQGIVGALIYYGWAIDNKILAALSDIGTQQFKENNPLPPTSTNW